MFLRSLHQSVVTLITKNVFLAKTSLHINVLETCPHCAFITPIRYMAGHSKWQNIRHTKGAKDKDRSQVINRYTQLIRAAVKVGGPDAKYNIELLRAISRAKEKEVPVVKIEQAINDAVKVRTTGSLNVVEASGPGNSSIIIEVFTDNMNRTRHAIGSAIKKLGGKMREHGFAKKRFECKGNLIVHLSDTEGKNVDDFIDIAIEAGAEDVILEDGGEGLNILKFISSEEDMFAVKKTLQATYEVKSIEKDYVPKMTVLLSEEDMGKAEKLFDNLESVEEVVRYFDNIEIPS